MKKACLILTTLALAATSMADIQAPPGAQWNPVSKFGRGLANLVYGFTEVPAQLERSNHREGSSQFPTAIATGAHKTVIRLAWGLYDVVTFPFPTYKGGYAPPYPTKQDMNPDLGYADYPPELGFKSGFQHNRIQTY